MRPEVLFPLYAPLDTLPGVGPALVKTLKRLGLHFIIDLLWHLPSGIASFPFKPFLKDCEPGKPVALLATIVSYEPPPTKRQPFKVLCDVEGIPLILVFFKTYRKSLEARLPLGQKRLLCGNLEQFLGTWQMTHPERILFPDSLNHWQEKTPLYPLTAGLFQGQVQKLVHLALKRVPDLPEWLPPALQTSWLPWKKALLKVHSPEREDHLDPHDPLRERLAFDELFADQLVLGLTRRTQIPGKAFSFAGKLKERLLKAFGHPLTPGQRNALAEIEEDLRSPHRMIRLLQGDVGSGKTLVALIAMADAIEAGFQAALLVPTEVLAMQHMKTLTNLAEEAGIKVALLLGRQSGKQSLYKAIEQGAYDLVIGTHALLEDAVKFPNLGLVVVDEQHRFGVEQRLRLTQKGQAVDVLVMTATPIPRTLRLTAYGDVEVSRILDKPKGRKAIQTRLKGLNHLEEVYEGIKRLIQKREKAYWVCPLVEESEVLDLAAAKDRYAVLATLFGTEKVGLVHGKQKSAEKEAAMTAFREGTVQILVATTVIEVGIDVKDAHTIIIEHAERFGLAQLHQLRGRVGRGDQESHCLLLYGYPLSETAKERLITMRETDDGFRIAEADLALRGGGDILGTKQSGLPAYRLADPLTCRALLERAHKEATFLLEEDPDLKSPRGQAARLLLSLFGQEKVMQTLLSG